MDSSGPCGDEFYETFERAVTESGQAARNVIAAMGDDRPHFLTGYTPDNPPPPGEAIWSDVNGTHHLRIYNMHVVPAEDLIPLGTHVVGSECAHEGTCSDYDRKLLGGHVVSREDTTDG